MKTAALVLLAFLAACGNPAEQPQKLHEIPLAIEKQSGGIVVFIVQLADTPETTAKGLMWVTEMPENHGMLFKFPQASVQSFWMRNTFIPLDILFIGAGGQLVHIHEKAQPHDETPISSRFPVAEVLEINGGMAAKLGLQIGDRVMVAKPTKTD